MWFVRTLHVDTYLLHMQIIDSETFTKTEDHEVLIEKKKYELEHRCVCNHSCCCAPPFDCLYPAFDPAVEWGT